MNPIRATLADLEKADIPYSFRRWPSILDPPPGGEVDLWMAARDLKHAEPLFAAAGLHHVKTPGHPGHRFFVGFWEGRWLKLDVKLQSQSRERPEFSRLIPRVREGSRATPYRKGVGGRLRRMAAKRRPAALRRLGPVVAVLGPDGSGKGTVIQGLSGHIPVGVTRLYLGRQGRPDNESGEETQDTGRQAGAVREAVFLVWKALQVWRQLLRGYAAAWRGHVVLCDRHPVEILAIRPRRTRLGSWIEGSLVRLMPWPDAIVILDAPAELLHTRKLQHSIATLERWRESYAKEFLPRGAVLVSTDDIPEVTLAQVSTLVWDALRARRSW